MASNRGLTNQEILDKLFADDQEKDAVPNIGVDAQSDAEEAETEYEEDSEEDDDDYTDPLQYLSSGLAPVMQPVQNVGLLPDNQVAGSPYAAVSSTGITSSPAPGWRPENFQVMSFYENEIYQQSCVCLPQWSMIYRARK